MKVICNHAYMCDRQSCSHHESHDPMEEIIGMCNENPVYCHCNNDVVCVRVDELVACTCGMRPAFAIGDGEKWTVTCYCGQCTPSMITRGLAAAYWNTMVMRRKPPPLFSISSCPACGKDECFFAMKYVKTKHAIKRTCPRCEYHWYERSLLDANPSL